MESKYILIDNEIIPEVYSKVLEAKALIKSGEASGISEAVKMVNISRSAYYKYHKHIFQLSQGREKVKKATLRFVLCHQHGVLSNILNYLADTGGNILTISQDIPINDIANLSITLDISGLKSAINESIEEMNGMDGVVKVELLAVGY